MRIAAVKHSVPSRRVTNETIIETLRAQNSGRYRNGELDRIEQRTRAFLRSGGTETRYYRTDGEVSSQFLLSAARDALQAAGIDPLDVGFIVYVGVGRGWLEPAMANLVQAELKCANATSFDVLDACASWLRGLQIAQGFLAGGAYRVGLVVNCECNIRELLDFDIEDEDALDRKLASFTVGEAATATVVTRSDDGDDFYFKFTSYGDHLRLCMIALDNAGEFMSDAKRGGHFPGQFVAHSRELVKVAIEKAVEVYRSDPQLNGFDYDLIVSHAIGAACWSVGRMLRLPMDRYFDTHPRFGNTVSASVPLALSLALGEQRLKRGDRVLAIVPSAGFTMAYARFKF